MLIQVYIDRVPEFSYGPKSFYRPLLIKWKHIPTWTPCQAAISQEDHLDNSTPELAQAVPLFFLPRHYRQATLPPNSPWHSPVKPGLAKNQICMPLPYHKTQYLFQEHCFLMGAKVHYMFSRLQKYGTF